MRAYIDIINESNFLLDSYSKLKPLNEAYVFEDFRSLYQKAKGMAERVLASGKPWESTAQTMLQKTMSPNAASQFFNRAMSVASATYQGGKAAAAVLALCGVVMLSNNAKAAQMDDHAIQVTLNQVAPDNVQLATPDAVNAATPAAAPSPTLRTPDAVNAATPAAAPSPTLNTPDAVNARQVAPDTTRLRTPDAVNQRPVAPQAKPLLRTPDAVNARPVAPDTTRLRTPDKVTRRPIAPPGQGWPG